MVDFEIQNEELIKYNGCEKVVEIPNGVKIIKENAFSGNSNIEKVIMPQSIEVIGDYAFCDCKNLKTVVVCEGLRSIGKYAFRFCFALENMNFPNSLKQIGYYALTDTSISLAIISDDCVFDIPQGLKELPFSKVCRVLRQSYMQLPKPNPYRYIGDNLIEFGVYPQTKKPSNLKLCDKTDKDGYYTDENGERYFCVDDQYYKFDPIVWNVYDTADGTLLVSAKILDYKCIDANKQYTYPDTSIRKWLNQEFLNMAFTTQEQQSILDSVVDNSPTSTATYFYSQYRARNRADKDEYLSKILEAEYPKCKNYTHSSMDKIFLLSEYQALLLQDKIGDFDLSLPRDTKRQLSGTAYSYALGVDDCWWLRTPIADYTDRLSCIVTNGSNRVMQGWVKSGIVPALYLKKQ